MKQDFGCDTEEEIRPNSIKGVEAKPRFFIASYVWMCRKLKFLARLPTQGVDTFTSGALRTNDRNALRENDRPDELRCNHSENVLFSDVATRRSPDPYAHAGCISRLFFHWPYALLRLGMQRTIQEEDLPEISVNDSSKHNLIWFEKLWQQELSRVKGLQQKRKDHGQVKPSLQRALIVDFLKSTWIIQPLLFGSELARILQAISLGYLIESMTLNSSKGYIWATVLTLCNCYTLFEHHHVFFIAWRKGMQFRMAAVAAIFSKSLRLSSIVGIHGIPSGQVMNLVSSDVERLVSATLFGSYIIWGPVIAIGSLVAGIQFIGPAFAAGFGLLVCIFVPLQFYLSQRFANLRSKVAVLTDARVTLVSQAVNGCRVMKMSGWEVEFEKRIAKVRQEEIMQIQKANRLKAWNEAVYYACNVVISATIFIVHVASGGILSSRTVFSTITLINAMQIELTKHFSLGVMGLSECWVSVRRIQAFLEIPEIHAVNEKHTSSSMEKPESLIMKPSSSSLTPEIKIARFGSISESLIDSRDLTESPMVSDTGNGKVFSLEHVTCCWNAVAETVGTVEATTDLDMELNLTNSGVKHDNNDITLSDVALSNVTVDFEMNSLTFIIGVVGSGKSALLQALIGELPVAQGCLKRKYDSLAYSPQDPWIMNGTIRENIMMGLPVDEAHYQDVTYSCGLLHDFSLLLNGDKTVVGDRGVQLSGGQRARISLARALYRNSDVVLLDDPLSAVDANVGKLIFYSAIHELCLKRGKCVILVTHQHQFIGDSRCILMAEGKISEIGSFADCVNASNGRLSIVAQNLNEDEKPDISMEAAVVNSSTSAPVYNECKKESHSQINDDNVPSDGPEDKHDSQLSESKAEGVIGRGTYITYARALGGYLIVVIIVLLFTITQGSTLSSILVMGRWAQRPPNRQKDASFIGLIAGLAFSVLILSITRSLFTFSRTIQASQHLHDDMARAVLRAKVAFFDTNPSGRILNRFSADVGSNDDNLPGILYDFTSTFFLTLGAIVTCIIVLPFILIIIPLLFWYFLRSRNIFVTTSRELKRLEGTARSPIYAMLNESLSGIATIRANNVVSYFQEKFTFLQNIHSRALFAFIAGSRWVGFRMDSIMFINITAACYLAVLFNQQGWFKVDGVVLGLSLTFLIQLSGLFQWCIRLSAEVVNAFVSVERVAEYSALPSEAAIVLESDSHETVRDWPRSGKIEVLNLSARYRPVLPLSLKNISFTVESGKRVGVVGRTGSGKSTLVQCVLRLLEAEQGTILIDGVDISSLGLHKLRKEISVINQVPTLFSGCSVRENLDPFGDYSDSDILDALDDVQMRESIDELELGIHSMVSEGGSNFSVGQRQLLCLARAILRKNKILILDEPTANVDVRTDKLLQEAVSRSFHGATIISVAHRLDTIIDYDMILVLGNGSVLEYGHPHHLLTGSLGSGHFASLVADTGHEMAQELHRRARENAPI